MNKYAKSIIVLISICLVVAALMAAVNHITAPIIEKANAAKEDEAFKVVMPNGEGFEKFDFSNYKLPTTVTEVYKEKNGGYVFKLNATGYQPNMIIICGINSSGIVTGATCTSSNETWGKEKTFGDLLIGKDSQTVLDVEAGATSKTINGYRSAVKDALDAFAILGGADLDVRTEEEILAENLSNALPTGDKFDDVFVAEVLDGVDTVYKAENGAGYVFVCGEAFVGADADGNVISDADAELKAKVESAAQKLLASESAELDISAIEGISSRIVSVKKTLSGNYIVRVKGAGYGRYPKAYHASGKYMIIDLSITPDGKIINCYTVEQYESENVGDKCADYKFYSQFNGKDETNYDDIDAISGATITTKGTEGYNEGYTKAVKNALDTVKMLVQEGM